MTLEEFENAVCSRKSVLSPEAKDSVQTILSTIRVVARDKFQLQTSKKILDELTGLFSIRAAVLVIHSSNAVTMVTAKPVNSAASNQNSFIN